MIHPQNIHIVGTGTIGEPLIGLLQGLRYAWNLGEITFHKHTPRPSDRPRIAPLILIEGHFVCIRRATDVSQEKGFPPAPEASG